MRGGDVEHRPDRRRSIEMESAVRAGRGKEIRLIGLFTRKASHHEGAVDRYSSLVDDLPEDLSGRLQFDDRLGRVLFQAQSYLAASMSLCSDVQCCGSLVVVPQSNVAVGVSRRIAALAASLELNTSV